MVIRSVAGLILGLCLMVMAWVNPVLAADTGHGAKVFASNCAACHVGGGNVVNRAKTLKMDALSKYEMDSLEAIATQIIQGKNAMPAFAGRLTEQEVEDVAAYVLLQAEQGW